MTQPVSYTPAVGFQAEETAAVAGRSAVRTSALDAELQAVSLTLSQILANLAVIQRDDTGLRDLVVTTESLSANVKALFAGGINPRGAWLTATAYAVKDVVETLTPLISYVCVIAHTSGVFATDRAAGKWMVLGSEPGVGTLTSLTLTTGGITLGTNNTQDLAATANRFRSGYFGTTVFAGTSVLTPLVGTATAATFGLMYNNAAVIQLNNTTIVPVTDNTMTLGLSTNRWASVSTPIIDSGTVGSLSLKTNNGTEQVRILHVGSAVNTFQLQGSATGAGPYFGVIGTDADVAVNYYTKGAGAHNFSTAGSGAQQFQVLHSASASRNITVTGSNGGNPTISTTAGFLNFGVGVVGSAAAGTGTGLATLGGVLNVNTTVVGNVGAGPDDLMTYSLPANSLSANAKGVRITAWGRSANNANAKRLVPVFGSSLASWDLTASIDGAWRAEVIVIRTGANTQKIIQRLSETVFGAAPAAPKETMYGPASTEVDTAAIAIKFVASIVTANNDITQEGMIVEFFS